MNLKRWFAWLCLALAVFTEVLLFRANHAREAAFTDAREAQVQMRQMQAELAELKNSATGQQADEIARLRKQNEILTNKLAQAQADAARWRLEGLQASQHLTTARTALELQQQHLQDLEAEKQRLALAGAAVINQNTCINNLRQIDAAKQQWALENNRNDDDIPTAKDLLPYLKNGVFPVCPAGGKYSINAVGELPTCSIPGHALPQ
jgi:hypothetical protein